MLKESTINEKTKFQNIQDKYLIQQFAYHTIPRLICFVVTSVIPIGHDPYRVVEP